MKLTRSRTRLLVQVAIAAFVFSMVVARYADQYGIPVTSGWPDLHGLCPIGMVESIGAVVTGEGFVETERTNTWILLGALLSAALLGAVFCGWICPLGAVQDWVGRLGRRVFGKRFNRVPEKADRRLSWLRYAVLALVLVQSIRFIGLVASTFNPSRALLHVWFAGAFPGGIAVLSLTLAGSLLVSRPWCRWLCPFGAVQGALGKLSPLTIRRNAAQCPSCGRCSRTCPMGVNVHEPASVRDSRCTRCTECLDACPFAGVLAFSASPPRQERAVRVPATESRRPAARVATVRSATALAAAAVVLLFLPVTIARAAGAYRPAGTSTAATITPDGIGPTMTLREVADGFGLSTEELLERLEMDHGFDPDTRIFDIEDDERYEHITVAYLRAVMSEAP